MAYGVLYEFHRTSTNGADMLITISQKGYNGAVKKRALGRAPVIKRDNNGHIYGTSCELYAECLVDGEFSQLYTSDAFEFRVEVYKNGSLLWVGFVSPELYSEPDIAPPYDVQIIATDGLGELKNYNFEKRDNASFLSHISYLVSKSGVDMDFNIVSDLRYVDSDGISSSESGLLDIIINLDHEVGNSCYDVLQNIMTAFNANITQHNGSYLIFRETDFIAKASGSTVEAFNSNGSRVYLPADSFGSMQANDWWPIGQLSTIIEPAKNKLVLKSPQYYDNNILKNEWTLNAGASYNNEEAAYSLPELNSSISQTVDFGVEVGYRLGLRVRARNVGEEAEQAQGLGIQIQIEGRTSSAGNIFWLTKTDEASGSSRPLADYIWRNTEGNLQEDLPSPSLSDGEFDAQDIDLIIPLYRNSARAFAYAKKLTVTIFNPVGAYGIYVYDISLVKYEQLGGHIANVIINNSARESESEIDLSITDGELAPAAASRFMTGLPLLPATEDVITQWKLANSTNSYLSTMAYDYSRAVALPKMKYSGSLNVPGSAISVPTLFMRDGTYYFPKTYSYDLYNDEMVIELISISSAYVSIGSISVSQYAKSTSSIGGVSTGTPTGENVITVPPDTMMSDTSENPVQNKVIKDYVDSTRDDLNERIDHIEGDLNDVASLWKVDEDGNLWTDRNVYSTKEISAGGVGEEGEGEGGYDIVIDTEMSDFSENAVQNKVIKKYVDDRIDDIVIPEGGGGGGVIDLSDYAKKQDLKLLEDRVTKNEKDIADIKENGGGGGGVAPNELQEWYQRVGKKIGWDEDGLHTDENFRSSKEISAGGVGEEADTPVSGTVTAVKVDDGEPIYPDNDGVVDISDALEGVVKELDLEKYAKKDDLNALAGRVTQTEEKNIEQDNSLNTIKDDLNTIVEWYDKVAKHLDVEGETLHVDLNIATPKEVSAGGVGEEGEIIEGDVYRMFHHKQTQPSAEWKIYHGLGKYPNVKIVDTLKQLCLGDVYYDDENNVTIKFGGAESGDAYLD